MKRLCVFYKNASAYLGKQIDWIVCKECSKKLQRGKRLTCTLRPALHEKQVYCR